MATTDGRFQPRERTLFERIAEPIVASRAGSWWFINVAPTLDRALMRISGGRLTTAGLRRVGVLRVKGAKTGELRETPLQYTLDGDDVLLVASRGGDVKHPAWYHNLVAHPDVTFTFGGEERAYRALVVEPGPERERDWFLVCERYSGYRVYQRRAGDRLIPIVRLTPAASR